MKSLQAFLLLLFSINSINSLIIQPCKEIQQRDATEADMKRCGGGGGPPPPPPPPTPSSGCNKRCFGDLDCQGQGQAGALPPCPYCKRITATNWRCRADTCSMFCFSTSECKGSCSNCRFFKCKGSGSGGCFPGKSEVVLEGGESRRMDEVRLGDRLLTIEGGRLDTTEVLGFLDKRINATTSYLNLVLENGGSLFVSSSHVIFIKGEDNKQRDILAKDAQVGDVVFVQDGRKTALARILDIRREEQLGAYVPLTTSGTLLVDGVLVSCYTNAGHWLAHGAMAPLRWWPLLLLDDELSQDTEGLRTFPGLMKELGRALGLLEQDGGRAAGTLEQDGGRAAGTLEQDGGRAAGAGTLEEAGFKTAGWAPVGLANCEL